MAKNIVGATALCLAGWCLHLWAAPVCFEHPSRLLRIVDGDTVQVRSRLDFEIFVVKHVRLARIEAPESGQPGHEEAVLVLKDILRPDQEFKVKTCAMDKYGRWIGEITIPGGGNVSDIMLKSGKVKPYKGG